MTSQTYISSVKLFVFLFAVMLNLNCKNYIPKSYPPQGDCTLTLNGFLGDCYSTVSGNSYISYTIHVGVVFYNNGRTYPYWSDDFNSPTPVTNTPHTYAIKIPQTGQYQVKVDIAGACSMCAAGVGGGSANDPCFAQPAGGGSYTVAKPAWVREFGDVVFHSDITMTPGRTLNVPNSCGRCVVPN